MRGGSRATVIGGDKARVAFAGSILFAARRMRPRERRKAPCQPSDQGANAILKGLCGLYDPRRDAARSAEMGQGTGPSGGRRIGSIRMQEVQT